MLKKNNESTMSPLQKKACIVLACCAGVVVVVACVCALLLHSWSKTDIPSPGNDDLITEEYDKESFLLDASSTAILSETKDAGADYLKETVFVGDSNTVRMYSYGLITLDQFVGKVGLGIQNLAAEPCVYFKNDSNVYTIPEALSKMKPRRVVVMMGTNNVEGLTSAENFVAEYRKAVSAMQAAYPYCDIIVAAVPPIPANHSSYPNMRMQTIDEMNLALLKMCEEDGLAFLNSSEALKDENGFGAAEYFAAGDIHFTKTGLNALLKYVSTHALETRDGRPDTRDIPRRADTPKSNSSTSMPEAESFTASYYAQKGGTLSCDSDIDKSELEYKVGEKSSITVIAVADDGYEFFKWSDGVTTATRTDKEFTQDISVTAMFNEVKKLEITLNTDQVNMVRGSDNTLVATVEGGDASKVVWGGAAAHTGESYSLKKLSEGEYTITATITVEGVSKSAECKVVVIAPTPTPAPTATPSPTPAPTAPPKPTAEPTPEPPVQSPDNGSAGTPAPEITPVPVTPENSGEAANTGASSEQTQ